MEPHQESRGESILIFTLLTILLTVLMVLTLFGIISIAERDQGVIGGATLITCVVLGSWTLNQLLVYKEKLLNDAPPDR